jgi:molybdate transport system substrate-binding protein
MEAMHSTRRLRTRRIESLSRVGWLAGLLGAVSLPAHAAEPVPTSSTRSVAVFAAASLTDAFKALGAAFEQAHPGVAVQFNFAGSSTLVQQIRDGAPADVFASADEPNMQKAADAGDLAGPARTFALNRLVIAVPAGNPSHIASLADLTKSGLTLALAAPQVPAGRYAAAAFAKAGVAVPPASQELDVRAVLNKVSLHEVDAGIVYVTDVRAASGKVDAIPIPDQYNVTARYPIAVLKTAADSRDAASFVDYVVSSAGQARLKEFGFMSP